MEKLELEKRDLENEEDWCRKSDIEEERKRHSLIKKIINWFKNLL